MTLPKQRINTQSAWESYNSNGSLPDGAYSLAFGTDEEGRSKVRQGERVCVKIQFLVFMLSFSRGEGLQDDGGFDN